MIFLNIMLIGDSNGLFPWKYTENTHLAITQGISSVEDGALRRLCYIRGIAQLVARTAGGREVAGSSPVTPTKLY